MKRMLSLLLVSMALSCTSPDAGPPPVNLDNLAPLVAELQVAEALATEVPVLVRDSIRQVFFDRVLADHQMDRTTFDSLTWIVRKEPNWVDSLYSKVNVILAKEEVDPESN